MVAAIETENLTRRFGVVTALDNVSLTIAKGEFFSLLGPSGCGKTTLLRLIAGLDVPDGGSLKLNGNEAASIPAHQRPVNTVFQSYALFPHMTVEQNVAFGLKMKKADPQKIAGRVSRVMEMVEISPLSKRKPSQISGGQRQRVALARAIVNEPDVLLLDEPLGALDLKLRKQLQTELRQLQRRLGITFVYVTHDQEEALVMSDRIAVMNHGRVEQLGAPAEIYDRPRTRFAAEFLGSCNVLAATLCARLFKGVEAGNGKSLTVRPENIRLAPLSTGGISGKIISIVYGGSQTHYEVQIEEQILKAFVLNSHDGARYAVGQEVAVSVSPEAWRILED